jgi:hypothetical protein
MTWSEQQRIEFQAPEYLWNIIRIISETGLRVFKELMPMKKEQVDLENEVVWIPDSKTPNGIAEVPDGSGSRGVPRADANLGAWDMVAHERREFHRPSEKSEDGLALNATQGQGAVLPNLRSAVHLRDSLKPRGRGADEWVTQLLQQGDAKVFNRRR